MNKNTIKLSLVFAMLFIMSPVLANASTYNSSNCDVNFNTRGYYGSYYNLPNTHKNIKNIYATYRVADQNDWYDSKYLSFSRVDRDIDFGKNFFPIDNELPGDPHYFAVNWRALIDVPSDGNYSYTIASDDDSWVFIDDKLVTELGGVHGAVNTNENVYLTKGLHKLEIFYAERARYKAIFSFETPTSWKIYPLINDCNSNNYNNTNTSNNNNSNTGGYVLGATDYGLGEGVLMKINGQSAVYFLTNSNVRHLFVNEPTFWSWHSGTWKDQAILAISQELFDQTIVGKNIVIKPERKLIRFDNSNITYEVVGMGMIDDINAYNSRLRYGSNWLSDRVTIQKAFENDYQRVE